MEYQLLCKDLVIVLSGLCINLTRFLFYLLDHHWRDRVGKMASDNIQRSYSIIPCFIFVEVSFCVLVFGCKYYMTLMGLFFQLFICILSCDSGHATHFYTLHGKNWIFPRFFIILTWMTVLVGCLIKMCVESPWSLRTVNTSKLPLHQETCPAYHF